MEYETLYVHYFSGFTNEDDFFYYYYVHSQFENYTYLYYNCSSHYYYYMYYSTKVVVILLDSSETTATIATQCNIHHVNTVSNILQHILVMAQWATGTNSGI